MYERGIALTVKVREVLSPCSSGFALCSAKQLGSCHSGRREDLYWLKGSLGCLSVHDWKEGGWEREESSVAMCYPGAAFTSHLVSVRKRI